MLRLKALSLERNISISELGRRTGINRTVISQIASGRIRATPSELAKIATVFGVPPASLISEVQS